MTDVREAHILVGVDGSEESLAALRWAIDLGYQEQRPVEVVHCWKPQTLSDVFLATAHELNNASSIMLENEVRAALSERSWSPSVSQFSVRGNPATTLVERSVGASTLVLGAHNRTVLKDLVLGGVARACLKHALCPVVIIDREGRPVPIAASVQV